MIRIVKAIKAVPVTPADRAAFEQERLQHEQIIGHLNVRWTRLSSSFGEATKAAEKRRKEAGDQERSAREDYDGGVRDLGVRTRLDSASARRIRADARLGKLWRWRRDIGGSVRARAALFAKRVNEIDKLLVSGVQEVAVEIRIDSETGMAEVTRLDTGHIVVVHEMTAAQKRKYAPPAPAETAQDRTAPLPFPKTDEEIAAEQSASQPDVVDEMPKVGEEFAEFIHRGRSVDDRLVREFGAAEARRIIDAIKAGEPGDVVIDQARARKAASKAGTSSTQAAEQPADRLAAAAAAFDDALPPKQPRKPRAKKGGAS